MDTIPRSRSRPTYPEDWGDIPDEDLKGCGAGAGRTGCRGHPRPCSEGPYPALPEEAQGERAHARACRARQVAGRDTGVQQLL